MMDECKTERASMGVTATDMWLLLMSTIRYSMGRASYMPSTCEEFLVKYSPMLSIAQLRQIGKEVEEELVRAERSGHLLGMQCDHDTWRQVVGWCNREIERRLSRD